MNIRYAPRHRNRKYITVDDLDLISISGFKAPAIPATSGATTDNIVCSVVSRTDIPTPTNPIVEPAAKCGPKSLIVITSSTNIQI